MPFPEILDAMKRAFGGFGSKPIELGLKGGVSFDAVNVGWYARNGYPGIYGALSGGLPAWSGEVVSTESALNHSVVYACNRLIAGTIGMIPCVMLQTKGGAKQLADSKPMYSAMLNAPNDEITAMGFTEMLTSHTLLGGNSYAKITRRSGTGVAIGLDPLLPQQVRADRERDGRKRLVYVVREADSTADKTYTVTKGQPHDILHIRGLGWDGVRGYSVITMGRQSIGTAQAGERNVGRFWANGGRVPYVLNLPRKWASKEDADQYRAAWDSIYSDPNRAPMMEPGFEYKQIGLSAKDSQMLESRLFGIHEICRWFGVPPHLVGDLSRATFSNIEQLALEFEKLVLADWATRWEQDLWRCILTDEEKTQGYHFKHDFKVMRRGDFQSRMQGYATALQNGWMNVDEVRDQEDMNALPEGAGSHYHIQLNMQTLPNGGQPLQSQAAQLVRLGAE